MMRLPAVRGSRFGFAVARLPAVRGSRFGFAVARLPALRGLRFGFVLAALGLLAVAGCSGLNPETDDGGTDPNSPCSTLPEVVLPFPSGYGPVGTETTLDVATWNIQNFPKAGSTTVDRVAGIINTLQLDLFGVEEVEDTLQFRALLAKIPEYDGFYSPDVYGFGSYQKTAVIYRKSTVTIESAFVPPEFQSYSYAFASRLPMDILVNAHDNGFTYRFHFMVVHLKAGTANEDDAARRRQATKALHDYMDKQSQADPNVDFLVIGDWNDYLNDPMASNSFPAFLSDTSDYKFLTLAFLGHTEMNSHPIGQIDQMLVNRGACPEFTAGKLTTLRLDQIIDGYTTYVSDHRPVMIAAPVFK